MGRNKSSTGICTEHLMSHCGFLSWSYLHHFLLASCRKRFSVNRDTRDSHFICSECARRSTSLFFITFLSCERNYETCFGWIPLLSLNFWIPHFATDTLYGRLGFILSTQRPYMSQAKSLLISRNTFMTNALSSCQFFFSWLAKYTPPLPTTYFQISPTLPSLLRSSSLANSPTRARAASLLIHTRTGMNRMKIITEILQHAHNNTPQLVGLLWTGDRLDVETSILQHTTLTIGRPPYPSWNSNPQSQQASGRRPSP